MPNDLKPKPIPNHENPLVAIIRLLPTKVRERAFYFSALLIAGVVVFGLWHAPGTTLAGGSSLGLVAWIKGFFGK